MTILDRAVAFMDRHGDAPVLHGRVVPGLRSLISIPAGPYAMPLSLPGPDQDELAALEQQKARRR